jgi:hypothetical protein
MLEGKGCRVVLGIIVAVLILGLVVPTLFTGMMAGGGPQGGPAVSGPIAAEIGKEKLSMMDLDRFVLKSSQNMVNQRRQQMQIPDTEPPTPLSPMEEAFQVYPGAVDQMVKGVHLLLLAQKEGVDLSENSPEIAKAIDEGLTQQKDQLIAMKKLTATSTQEEIEKAFKEASGKTYTELRTENITSIKNRMKDPAEAADLRRALANLGLQKKYESGVKPTDEQLNAYFTTTLMKRVHLTRAKNPNVDVVKRAGEIRADILAKKLTFEDAMDRYTNETAEKGKRARDLSFELDGVTGSSDPTYIALPKLKPGEISEVVDTNDGASIFIGVGKKPQFPADFKTNRANYEKQYASTMAVRKLQDNLKAIGKEAPITWKSKGVHVLYDMSEFEQSPESFKLSEKDRDAKLNELLSRANDAVKSDTEGKKYAEFARLALLLRLEFGKKPEQAAALQQPKATAIEAVLSYTESPEARIELARIYGQMKNAEKTAENLSQAARAMNGRFGQMDQFLYSTLTAQVAQFETSKLLTADMLKAIREPLTEWRKGKVEYDKQMAQMKKEQDEMMKKAMEEQKKAEAEAKKNAPAPAPKPKTGN